MPKQRPGRPAPCRSLGIPRPGHPPSSATPRSSPPHSAANPTCLLDHHRPDASDGPRRIPVWYNASHSRAGRRDLFTADFDHLVPSHLIPTHRVADVPPTARLLARDSHHLKPPVGDPDVSTDRDRFRAASITELASPRSPTNTADGRRHRPRLRRPPPRARPCIDGGLTAVSASMSTDPEDRRDRRQSRTTSATSATRWSRTSRTATGSKPRPSSIQASANATSSSSRCPPPSAEHQEPDLSYIDGHGRADRPHPASPASSSSSNRRRTRRTTRDEMLPVMLATRPSAASKGLGRRRGPLRGIQPGARGSGPEGPFHQHHSEARRRTRSRTPPPSRRIGLPQGHRRGRRGSSSAEIAESAKLLENIFRAVNIALVNEMKTVLTEMDIDVWEVVRAASTKPFGFMPFFPGPGLGGHCIPIDPFYLTWKAKEVGCYDPLHRTCRPGQHRDARVRD